MQSIRTSPSNFRFGVFNPEWNAAGINPILSEVIAAFTPGRCMFATNFPVEGIFKGYREVWNAY